MRRHSPPAPARKGGNAVPDSVHVGDCRLASKHVKPLTEDHARRTIAVDGLSRRARSVGQTPTSEPSGGGPPILAQPGVRSPPYRGPHASPPSVQRPTAPSCRPHQRGNPSVDGPARY
ncbi:DUF6233 domain-containing protein [Streptomyces sp. NPDC055912]|uniref:DUF6233 domain-containing protein n=1 Tax=unclassified Streptomyces TaxID=2593676 RepID=UPI0035DFC405